jgi:hypothetical protein
MHHENDKIEMTIVSLCIAVEYEFFKYALKRQKTISLFINFCPCGLRVCSQVRIGKT